MAATMYEVKFAQVVEKFWACSAASATPITVTSAVSFCRPMKSFRSGGTTRRTACGTTT